MRILQYIYYRSWMTSDLRRVVSPEISGEIIFWWILCSYIRLLLMGYYLITANTPLEIPILYYCGDLFAALSMLPILSVLVLIFDLSMDFFSFIGWKKVNYLETYKERWGNEPQEQYAKRGWIITIYNFIGITLYVVHWSADPNIFINLFKIPIIWVLRLFA